MTPTTGSDGRLGRREAAALFLAALVWFLPGIWWGLPEVTATTQVGRWGVDGLGPLGAINAIHALLGRDVPLSPQYPLGQYLVQALFVWPYYLGAQIVDNLGFPPHEVSARVLVLLHRVPSLLMAAGTVVAAATLARRATRSPAATWFAAATVATVGPIMHYARTSNVDAGALFWTAMALLPALDALRHGLTPKRAIVLGLCSAAGVATKDQQYAYFLGLAVVLLAVHLGTRRDPADGHPRWKAPLAGLGATTGAYLLLSGALLLPEWFSTHVDFIRHGSTRDISEALRQRIGFYYSSPATAAGYWQVVVETSRQLLAAVGAPVLALALAGAAHLAYRDRRLLVFLLIPPVALFAGVIVPVRFVLPRFLMPVDLILCLLAAVAVAEAVRFARWRGITRALATGAVAWGVVRGGDLTWQVLRDSRLEAAAWLDQNLEPGDTLGYYGARFKLPRLRRDLRVAPAPGQYLPEAVYGSNDPVPGAPRFLIVIPQVHSEPVHEWSLPDSTFRHLMDGTAGYQQVLAIQTAALFPRPLRVAPAVNPPVRVFARRDMVGRLPGPVRIELPDPVAARRP
jgi:hypothetical protein